MKFIATVIDPPTSTLIKQKLTLQRVEAMLVTSEGVKTRLKIAFECRVNVTKTWLNANLIPGDVVTFNGIYSVNTIKGIRGVKKVRVDKNWLAGQERRRIASETEKLEKAKQAGIAKAKQLKQEIKAAKQKAEKARLAEERRQAKAFRVSSDNLYVKPVRVSTVVPSYKPSLKPTRRKAKLKRKKRDPFDFTLKAGKPAVRKNGNRVRFWRK